jgi:hypothetical protein
MLDPTSRLGKMENFEYGGQTKKREKGLLNKYLINGPPNKDKDKDKDKEKTKKK